MPTNLLLLPLIAGYLFVHLLTSLRFRAQALDGYRLLIECAIAGTVLLFFARLATLLLAGSWLAMVWGRAAPDPPYLGTGVLSILLGVCLPLIENRRARLGLTGRLTRWILFRRWARPLRQLVRSARKAYAANRLQDLSTEIRLQGNSLIRLVHDAALRGSPISISLTNRKWYVGYVAEAANLRPNDTHLSLLPIISGFRDKDSLDAQRTLYYRDVYSRYGRDFDATLFLLTVRMSDIVEARLFDEGVYQDHFAVGDPPGRIKVVGT